MLALLYLNLLFISTVWCQTRTIWQYQFGPIVTIPSFVGAPLGDHTAEMEGFVEADPIPAANTDWLDCYPGDPNGNCFSSTQINTVRETSRPGYDTCWTTAAFTFYQTIITVPVGTSVTQFSVVYPENTVDDAVRLSIFNSLYPAGQIIAYTFIDEAATIDLASYITAGDNRVVITQMDACCCGNSVWARILLNGVELTPTCKLEVGPNPCLVYTWNPSQSDCDFVPGNEGATCDDGNACTFDDKCASGVCVGQAVVCSPAAPACFVGVCDATDGCTTVVSPDGTACDDGNGCTLNDVCTAGVCAGTQVTCATPDQCHLPGTCDPTTGVCSNPPKCDGKVCDDGNACTQLDTCKSGVCVGIHPVICTVESDCQEAGTCNPATGKCSLDNQCDGTSCNDGNACTLTDTCLDGDCIGSNPVVCQPLDQCHVAGVCDPATGACSNPNVADGTACNDGNACTQTDTCQAGVCVGSNPVVCTASDQCHVAGVCDPTSGVCSNPSKANGATCNDGNACTQTDTCQAGTCTGSNPVVCTASDQCHSAGTCNPASGKCSNPNKPDGTTCDDHDACTQFDVCTNGACSGTQVCCRTHNGRCGTCVSNCQGSHQSVLNLFKLGGGQNDVENGGNCSGGKVCCVPKDQSTCDNGNNSCKIPDGDGDRDGEDGGDGNEGGSHGGDRD